MYPGLITSEIPHLLSLDPFTNLYKMVLPDQSEVSPETSIKLTLSPKRKIIRKTKKIFKVAGNNTGIPRFLAYENEKFKSI